VEGIRVAAREQPHEPEGEETPRAKRAPSLFEEALRDSRAALVSKDPKENGGFKLALHLGWGVPVWYFAASLLLLAQHERTLRALMDSPGHFAAFAAVFLLGGIVGPLALPFATAFPLALSFYALQGQETRKRLRQALVCPYCRDEVEREGTVICARKGCGALYHQECWQECAQQYGGCAVYGCSSKKCREVSAAGYFVRLGRLGLAALLFPPKIARALRKAEGEGFAAIYRKAVAATRMVGVSTDENTNSQAKMAIHVGLSIAVIVTVAALAFSTPWISRWLTTGSNAFWGLVPIFFFVPIALPWIVALPLALAFFTLRAVAIAFKTELAQLGRADEGGGTVLGRLAAGFGKKS